MLVFVESYEEGEWKTSNECSVVDSTVAYVFLFLIRKSEAVNRKTGNTVAKRQSVIQTTLHWKLYYEQHESYIGHSMI